MVLVLNTFGLKCIKLKPNKKIKETKNVNKKNSKKPTKSDKKIKMRLYKSVIQGS